MSSTGRLLAQPLSTFHDRVMRTIGLFAMLVLGCDATHTIGGDSGAPMDAWTAIDAWTPAVDCPVVPSSLVGQPCATESASCGDTCCSDGVRCQAGTWTALAPMECLLCGNYACGDGHCPQRQTCVERCGPTGGAMFACVDHAGTCGDCSCIAITSTQRCDMVDGHPHVSETTPCF